VRIAAGIYAAVDFAIARPQVVEAVAAGSDPVRDYDGMIGRFAGFIQARAPIEKRLPGHPTRHWWPGSWGWSATTCGSVGPSA
jgi:hypothetical protein